LPASRLGARETRSGCGRSRVGGSEAEQDHRRLSDRSAAGADSL